MLVRILRFTDVYIDADEFPIVIGDRECCLQAGMDDRVTSKPTPNLSFSPFSPTCFLQNPYVARTSSMPFLNSFDSQATLDFVIKTRFGSCFFTVSFYRYAIPCTI